MELVHEKRRAKVWGFINALAGAGMFFGPFISTWLWQTQALVSVPFTVAAVTWIIQIPLIMKIVETKKKDTH